MTTAILRILRIRTAAWLTGACVLVGLAAVPVSSDAQPGLNQLSQQLSAQQDRQQHLQDSLKTLSSLISSLEAQISLVRSREEAVQAELDTDRAKLAQTQADLARERKLVALLKRRLAWGRQLLAQQLVSRYESDSPDLVNVVLDSGGFTDLLERLTYLRDAEHQQQQIIAITTTAKHQADSATRRLAKLEQTDRQLTADAELRRRALAGMDSLLQSREGALQQAQATQRAALSASQAKAGQLQSEINKIQAEQAAAAQQASSSSGPGAGPALGPSGGWAIPYAIVLCESGGQNLPPNSAGASGYYQIIPSTWALYGGSGPAAYLTSKAEQDAVATRIWAGGSGIANWDCARIVGLLH
jgi:septal ring factor EnvC (AmiA/AmiB activator)